jgi:hypothetical protein
MSVYDPAKYHKGSVVRIAPKAALEAFLRPSWKFHYPLLPEQLDYGGRTAKVFESAMYHGGDVLYKLEDAPGIWHERCLEAV